MVTKKVIYMVFWLRNMQLKILEFVVEILSRKVAVWRTGSY